MKSGPKLIFGCLVGLVGIACGPIDRTNSDDLNQDFFDGVGKADGIPRPVGTYVASGMMGVEDSNKVTSLTLKTDTTFHRVLIESCTEVGVCQTTELTGTYKYTKSGSSLYVRLFDFNGEFVERYAYTFKDELLKLRMVDPAKSKNWSALLHISNGGWCAEGKDCALQELTAQEACSGGYTCQKNECAFECNTTNPCSGIRGDPCPSGTWCSNGDNQDPKARDGFCATNDEFDDPWRQNLRPISNEQAQTLAHFVKGVQFEDSGDGKNLGVAWALLDGNHCGERAKMTQFALMMGSSDTLLPASISDDLLTRMVDNKQVDAAQINLMGYMHLKQSSIGLPGGSPLSGELEISWSNHRSTLINVEGELKVLDLSASDIPLKIDDWIAIYAPTDRVQCPRLSAKDAGDLNVFLNSRLGGMQIAPSKVLCGTTIAWGYHNSIEPKDGWGSLRWDFAVRYQLQPDFYNLKERFSKAGVSLTDEQVPKVTSSVKSDFDEFCAVAANCGPQCRDLGYWCYP